MRFEVLMVKILMLVFSTVMLHGLVGTYKHFEGTYCLHLQLMFLQNVGIYLQVHSVTTQNTNNDVVTASSWFNSWQADLR
jgi:hypothetical protein